MITYILLMSPVHKQHFDESELYKEVAKRLTGHLFEEDPVVLEYTPKESSIVERPVFDQLRNSSLAIIGQSLLVLT